MVPFSWVTSPWVEIKPQYKYILGLHKIEEEGQKNRCRVTVLPRHGNYGVVGEIAHKRTYWKNQINLIK